MSETEAQLVDEYHLSIVEKDSFKVVHLKFKCENGKILTFEFPPVYAHRLSDELCTTSIRAIAKDG